MFRSPSETILRVYIIKEHKKHLCVEELSQSQSSVPTVNLAMQYNRFYDLQT